MKDDLLIGTTYRPLPKGEKLRIQSILATGNLTIEALARRPGMTWEQRDTYRKIVVLNLRSHPECEPSEIAACRSLSRQEVAAVKAIEDVKYRLFEGMVARLVQLARRHVYIAKLFTDEHPRTLKNDLYAETMLAFCHACYRFNRYDIAFNTFLTTVVQNWLTDYCEKLAIVKHGEDLKNLVYLYYQIKASEQEAGRQPAFEEIVRIIVSNELRDRGIAATQHNIEAETEKSRERLLSLQQAIRRIVPVEPRHRSQEPAADVQAVLNDLTARLTPLQRQTIESKLEGVSMKDLAKSEGLSANEVGKAYKTAREILGAALV